MKYSAREFAQPRFQCCCWTLPIVLAGQCLAVFLTICLIFNLLNLVISTDFWTFTNVIALLHLPIIVALLYGTVKRRHNFILPFIAYQIFNLMATTITAILAFPILKQRFLIPHFDPLLHNSGHNHMLTYNEPYNDVLNTAFTTAYVGGILLVDLVLAWFGYIAFRCYCYLYVESRMPKMTDICKINA